MKKRVLALSAAMVVILGSGAAYAGDTVLYTPMLSAPTGGVLHCSATNVGKKPIPNISIFIISGGGGQSAACSDVPVASSLDEDATCTTGLGSPGAWCVIKITGASYKSVRAVLNVVDSSGATILSVPATK
jgi:hypothetical protein